MKERDLEAPFGNIDIHDHLREVVHRHKTYQRELGRLVSILPDNVVFEERIFSPQESVQIGFFEGDQPPVMRKEFLSSSEKASFEAELKHLESDEDRDSFVSRLNHLLLRLFVMREEDRDSYYIKIKHLFTKTDYDVSEDFFRFINREINTYQYYKSGNNEREFQMYDLEWFQSWTSEQQLNFFSFLIHSHLFSSRQVEQFIRGSFTEAEFRGFVHTDFHLFDWSEYYRTLSFRQRVEFLVSSQFVFAYYGSDSPTFNKNRKQQFHAILSLPGLSEFERIFIQSFYQASDLHLSDESLLAFASDPTSHWEQRSQHHFDMMYAGGERFGRVFSPVSLSQDPYQVRQISKDGYIVFHQNNEQEHVLLRPQQREVLEIRDQKQPPFYLFSLFTHLYPGRNSKEFQEEAQDFFQKEIERFFEGDSRLVRWRAAFEAVLNSESAPDQVSSAQALAIWHEAIQEMKTSVHYESCASTDVLHFVQQLNVHRYKNIGSVIVTILQESTFRAHLEHSMGISMNALTLSEQLSVCGYLFEVHRDRATSFFRHSNHFGVDFVRSFLSCEYGTRYGHAVLDLAERLDHEVAARIFKRYAQIVDFTEKTTDALLESVFLRGKQQMIDRDKLNEELLMRAKDIFSAKTVDTEEVLHALDAFQADLLLFLAVFKTAYKGREAQVPFSDLKGLSLTSFDVRELTDQKKLEYFERMKHVLMENWAGKGLDIMKEALHGLEAGFEDAFQKTQFYQLEKNGELVAFLRFDERPDLGKNAVYAGSFNVSTALRGSAIGTAFFHEVLRNEAKDHDVYAHVLATDPIVLQYMTEYGFEIYGEDPTKDTQGKRIDWFTIVRPKEGDRESQLNRQELIFTKDQTQQALNWVLQQVREGKWVRAEKMKQGIKFFSFEKKVESRVA